MDCRRRALFLRLFSPCSLASKLCLLSDFIFVLLSFLSSFSYSFSPASGLPMFLKLSPRLDFRHEPFGADPISGKSRRTLHLYLKIDPSSEHLDGPCRLNQTDINIWENILLDPITVKISTMLKKACHHQSCKLRQRRVLLPLTISNPSSVPFDLCLFRSHLGGFVYSDFLSSGDATSMYDGQFVAAFNSRSNCRQNQEDIRVFKIGHFLKWPI